MSIEKKTAEAVLEREQDVRVGGRMFSMPQPTLATLIMASELIAELPDFLKEENATLIEAVMKHTDKLNVIARIAAVFVLGAARIKEGYDVPVNVAETVEKRVLWFKRKKVEVRTEYVKEIDYIQRLIIETMTPKELGMMLAQCMGFVELKDFFGATVSLSGVNLLKSREAGMIASGD